jgi:tetratricopeptide (TPR) repeat protein
MRAQSKRVHRVVQLAALFVASVVGCRVASAEPLSFWDGVRDPAARKASDALEDALTPRTPMFDLRSGAFRLGEILHARARDAAVALELKGGEALASSDALYLLGISLVYGDSGRDEEGRRILRKALAADPESPLAPLAWFQVAVASNRLLDFESERGAYGEELRVQWDTDQRATLLSNRAESNMSLGDLADAKDDYLASLDSVTSSGSDVYALAAWGLAVAYARDDDLPDALKYAWKAAQLRFPDVDPTRGLVLVQAIDLPNVFYTPAHEIFFYRALGEMASAEHEDDPSKRRQALGRALELWDQYLAPAKKNGDRWIQNAEFQRRWCSRRLSELGVKQPSEPARSKAGSGSRSRRPPPTRAPD